MSRLAWLPALLFQALAWPGLVAGQSSLVTDSVASPGLASNVVGDGPVRRVVVYLPPSYNREPARRYPVLYLLHGVTSVPEEWLDGTYQGLDLRKTLDSLVAAGGIPEFILVMPDANNTLEASWYANSSTMGHWEDFVVQDLVRHVDQRYRTESRVERRALVGHSMGGFGALNIGFNHPGRFGFVYASSPCCIGFVGRLAPSAPTWAQLSVLRRWQDAAGPVRLVLTIAAALDGNSASPRLFDELPFSPGPDGAAVRDRVAEARWLARMPPDLATAMVRRGDRPPVLRIEAGSEETGILAGIQLLRGRLDSLRIPYRDTVFAGGHIDRVRERFTHHILPSAGTWFLGPQGQDTRTQFFARLRSLCGTRFEGASTFPTDTTDSFAGKKLVAEVASCTEGEVRVPFAVGEDRSRTWLFTRVGSGLQLKHDHRHADGTPDAVTMYGGMAGLAGSALSQSFAADAHTAQLIPAAATNVWTVSLSADGRRLTYHLERNGRPRFTAVLTRVPGRSG